METALKRIKSFNARYFSIHAGYWIFYVFFFTFQRYAYYQNSNFIPSLKLNLAYLPGVMLFTYFLTEFLIPVYFRNRKLGPFMISLISVLILYPFFAFLERKVIIEPYVFDDHLPYTLYNFFSAIMIFVFGAVSVAGFKIARLIKSEAMQHKIIENEKLEADLKLREAELRLLKGQIHPHFLFNTLNNAYSLALERSENTASVIIRLAEMFSFLTYDCNSDKVALEKDIQFVENYLELQRLRYDRCSIDMRVVGNLGNLEIAPMILHTYVENSFKHGAANVSENCWIKILISVEGRNLVFSVTNTKRKGEMESGNGIGLKNAGRRLELLYPGRYSLMIGNNEETYSVDLKMDLG